MTHHRYNCCWFAADLQVRDISTNEAWQDAMHLSVPVLAVLDEQGGEVRAPHEPRGYTDNTQTACATTSLASLQWLPVQYTTCTDESACGEMLQQ
jgi:hypothetical protein